MTTKIVTSLEVNLIDNVSSKTGKLKGNLVAAGKAIADALNKPATAVDIGSLFKFDEKDGPVQKIQKIADVVNNFDKNLAANKGKGLIKALGVDGIDAARKKIIEFSELMQATVRAQAGAQFGVKVDQFLNLTDVKKAKAALAELKDDYKQLTAIGSTAATPAGGSTMQAWTRYLNQHIKDLENGTNKVAEINKKRVADTQKTTDTQLTLELKAEKKRLQQRAEFLTKELALSEKRKNQADAETEYIAKKMLAVGGSENANDALRAKEVAAQQEQLVAREADDALVKEAMAVQQRLLVIDKDIANSRTKVAVAEGAAVVKEEVAAGQKRVRSRKQTAKELKDAEVKAVTQQAAGPATPEGTRLAAAQELQAQIIKIEQETSNQVVIITQKMVAKIVKAYKDAGVQLSKSFGKGKELEVRIKFIGIASPPRPLTETLNFLLDMIKRLGRDVDLSLKINDTEGIKLAQKQLKGYQADVKKVSKETGDLISGYKLRSPSVYSTQIKELEGVEQQIGDVNKAATGLAWTISKALGKFKPPPDLAEFAKNARNYMGKGPIEKQVVWEQLIKMSPPVPFRQGIDNIKKAFDSVGGTRDLTIQVKTTEGDVGSLEEAASKKAAAEVRLAEAQKARADAQGKTAVQAAKKEEVLAKQQLARWTETYDKRYKIAQESYAKLEALAVTEAKKFDNSSPSKLIALYRREQRERIAVAIEGGNQVLATARDEWEKRLQIEEQGVQEVAAAEKALTDLFVKTSKGRVTKQVKSGVTNAEVQAARQTFDEKKRLLAEERRLVVQSEDQLFEIANRELGNVEASTKGQVNIRRKAEQAVATLRRATLKEVETAEKQHSTFLASEEQKRLDYAKALNQRNAGTSAGVGSTQEARQRARMWAEAEKARVTTSQTVEADLLAIQKGSQTEFFKWRDEQDRKALERFLQRKRDQLRSEEELGAKTAAVLKRTRATEEERGGAISSILTRAKAAETQRASDIEAIRKRTFASEMERANAIKAINDRAAREDMQRAEGISTILQRTRAAEEQKAAAIEAINKRTFRSEMEKAAAIEAINKRSRREEEKLAADTVAILKRSGAFKVSIAGEAQDEVRQGEEQLAKDIVAIQTRSLREQKDQVAGYMKTVKNELTKLREMQKQSLASGNKKDFETSSGLKNQVEALYIQLGEANSRLVKAVRTGNKAAGDAAIADAEKVVESIKGIIGDATGGFGGLVPPLPPEDTAKKWEDRMTSLSYRFTHVGFQIGMFGAALKEAFTIPLDAAKELQKEIGFTAAVMIDGSASMDKMRLAAIEMGQKTIFSSQEAAVGLKTLSVAGLDARQSIALMPTVLEFAAAGMLSVDEAAQTLISTTTAFGVSLTKMPEIANTLAAAANMTNTTMKKMAHAFSIVGPAAHQLGLTVEETAVQIGLLSKAGIESGPAATQLSGLYRTLGQLATGTAPRAVQKTFNALGISLQDAKGEFIGMSSVVDQFNQKLAGMTGLERLGKLTEIFKTRSGPRALMAFMDQQTEALKKGEDAFKSLTKTMMDAASVEQIAAARSQDLFGALTMLSNAFLGLKQSIGLAAGAEGGPLNAMIGALTVLINKVSDFINYVPGIKFLLQLLMSAIALSGVFIAAAAAISLFAGTLFALTGIQTPVKKLWMDLKNLSQWFKESAKAAHQLAVETNRLAAAERNRAAVPLPRRTSLRPGGADIDISEPGKISQAFSKVGNVLVGIMPFLGRFSNIVGKIFSGLSKLSKVAGGPLAIALAGLDIFMRTSEWFKFSKAIEEGTKDATKAIEDLTVAGGNKNKITLLEDYKKQLADLKKQLKTQELIALVSLGFLGDKDKVIAKIEEINKAIGKEAIEINPEINLKITPEQLQELESQYKDLLDQHKTQLEKLYDLDEEYSKNRVQLEKQLNKELTAEDMASSDYRKNKQRIERQEKLTAEFEDLIGKDDKKSIARRKALAEQLNTLDEQIASSNVDTVKTMLEKRTELEKKAAETRRQIATAEAANARADAGRSVADYSDQREASARKIANLEQDIAKAQAMSATTAKEAATRSATITRLERQLTEARAASANYSEKEAESAEKVAGAAQRADEATGERTSKLKEELAEQEKELAALNAGIKTIEESNTRLANAPKLYAEAQADAMASAEESAKRIIALEERHNELVRRRLTAVAQQYQIERNTLLGVIGDLAKKVIKKATAFGGKDEAIEALKADAQAMSVDVTPVVQAPVPAAGAPGAAAVVDLFAGVNANKIFGIGVEVQDKSKPAVKQSMDIVTGAKKPAPIQISYDIDKSGKVTANISNVSGAAAMAADTVKGTMTAVVQETENATTKAEAAVQALYDKWGEADKKLTFGPGTNRVAQSAIDDINAGARKIREEIEAQKKDTAQATTKSFVDWEKDAAIRIAEDQLRIAKETHQKLVAEFLTARTAANPEIVNAEGLQKLAQYAERTNEVAAATEAIRQAELNLNQVRTAAPVKVADKVSQAVGDSAGPAAVTAIDEALKGKVFDVKVRVVSEEGSDLGLPLPGGRFGGLVNFFRGMAAGGHLPGYGGGDRRLTLLEDGEYVMPKEAVRGIGVDTLHRMRAFFAKGIGTPSFAMGIPRMAAGGVVGARGGTLGSYDVNISVGGRSFTFQTGNKNLAEQFANALRREELTTV